MPHIFTCIPNENKAYSGPEVTVKTNDEIDIYTIIENFKSYLLACGFQPESIKRAFNEEE